MKYWIQTHQIGRFKDAKALVEMAKLSEDLGFEALGLPDHIIFPVAYEEEMERSWPEQLTVAAYLAAHTSTLKFFTACTVATQRNPFLLAKQAATVDFLSGGRMGLNLAPGWLEEEIAWLGHDPRGRGKRLEEQIKLIRALFEEDPVSFEGEHYSIENASFHPKPTQKPLPIFVGGTPRISARRAARLGDGWQPSGDFSEFRQGLELLKDEMTKIGRSFEGFPTVPDLPIFDLPDNVIEHYVDTGTPAPEGFSGDYDKAIERVAEAESLGVTHCMIFPARFNGEELARELRTFSERMIQV